MNRIPTAPGRGRRILVWSGWLLLGLVLGAGAGATYGPELAGLTHHVASKQGE